jgi:Spy/CpxP family protein refolding chaperone
MRRLIFGGVLCTWFILALAGPAQAQSPSPFAWWKSEQFRKDLGLTREQCARIDKVFEAAVPRLRQSKQELDREETDLSRLIEADAGEAQVARQLDKVEAIRGNLNKMRTLMLLHQRELLSAEQRVKFKTLHEQWERDRRANSHAGSNSDHRQQN